MKKLIQIKNLKTYYPIKDGLFSKLINHVKAVDNITLDINKGETLGLVGESGCGKTTLGRTILGLESAHAGQIIFHEKDLLKISPKEYKVLRPKIQMIFQDPFSSLNPRMTILDILTEGRIEHDLLQKSKESDAKELLEDVGLDPEYIYRYPHEFSGGQRQRISIARAISLNPELIVCDEAVSALDVSVQAQVINLLKKLREKYEFSYLFITHDLSVVRNISQMIAVMYLGQIVEYGLTKDIINNPQHPYTKSLISAVPIPGKIKNDRIVLKGETPSASNVPRGCRFHTRCPIATEECKVKNVVLENKQGRDVACLLVDA